MKVKYFVTATINTKLVRFTFSVEQKAEAIATFKNLALRFRDAELFSIDSDDEDITYNLTNHYLVS